MRSLQSARGGTALPSYGSWLSDSARAGEQAPPIRVHSHDRA